MSWLTLWPEPVSIFLSGVRLLKKKGLPLFSFFLSCFFFYLFIYKAAFLPVLRTNPLHLVEELEHEAAEMPELAGLPQFGRKSL